jgi:sulfatase maturation enzyme AslB (radical SAM superfamily)
MKKQVFENINISSLTVTPCIVTTIECNADCSYCICDKSKEIKNMSEQTLNEIIEVFIKLHKKEKFRLILNFFGGEPLLKFDLIWNVYKNSKFFNELKHIPLMIATNLTVLPDNFMNFFNYFDCTINVSLDTFDNTSFPHKDTLENLMAMKKSSNKFRYKTVITTTIDDNTFDKDDFCKIRKFVMENNLNWDVNLIIKGKGKV